MWVVRVWGWFSPAISAPPLLAFCLRWPGPCRQVSTQPAALKYSPCHASSSGLSDLGASCLWTLVASCSGCSRGSFGARHAPTLPTWGAAGLPSRPRKESPILHLWLTFKAFSWPWPVRTVVVPWPTLCSCCLTFFPERWKKSSGPGSHVAPEATWPH
uniref:Secreted protein n=1 Tax=Molossus molossus TaxID=27622 RepID=A0A7J8ERU6_MOLMO|nr:hypothetical protein HJG59_008768 [Molossus molossus]